MFIPNYGGHLVLKKSHSSTSLVVNSGKVAEKSRQKTFSVRKLHLSVWRQRLRDSGVGRGGWGFGTETDQPVLQLDHLGRVLAQLQTTPCQPGTALLPGGSTTRLSIPILWPGSAQSGSHIPPKCSLFQSLRVTPGVHVCRGHEFLLFRSTCVLLYMSHTAMNEKREKKVQWHGGFMKSSV